MQPIKARWRARSLTVYGRTGPMRSEFHLTAGLSTRRNLSSRYAVWEDLNEKAQSSDQRSVFSYTDKQYRMSTSLGNILDLQAVWSISDVVDRLLHPCYHRIGNLADNHHYKAPSR